MVKSFGKQMDYLADSVAVTCQLWLGGLAGKMLSDLLITSAMLYHVSSFLLLPTGSLPFVGS